MEHNHIFLLPQDHPWGKRIHYYPCLDSTNTLAKQMAAAGAPEGTVVIAGCQTGGRGRLGRSFSSPAGLGLYLSVILRPGCKPQKLMHLTCAAGVAACQAVEAACGLHPGIKWANDLVHGRRKLGGILTELGFDSLGNVAWAVVGIGINCDHQPEDFPQELRPMAASLAMATGRAVNPMALAGQLVQSLYAMNAELMAPGPWMARYRGLCITLGQPISIHRGDEIRHGKAVSVADDGSLLVEYSDGSRGAVSSGEVSIRGMYGYL